MSDGAVYASVLGFVQFDVRDREVNGQEVREATVQSCDSQKLVSVTLWPQWADVTVAKGDLVAANGRLTKNQGTNKAGEPITYRNLSAKYFHNLGQLTPIQTEAVNSSGSSVSEDDAGF